MHNEIQEYLRKNSPSKNIGELKKSIYIYHLDGSFIFLNNCQIEVRCIDGMNPEIICVWTEHLGNYYFFIEDLHYYVIDDQQNPISLPPFFKKN